MFHYEVFGFGVQANFPIPELRPSERKVEVTFHLEVEAPPPPNSEWKDRWIVGAGNEIVATWENVGRFVVSTGNRISIRPYSGTDIRWVRLYLLGAPLAFLQLQRGFTVLHASAVDIQGQSVIFVGEKGMGKSTFAAALHAHGHRLLSDDVAVIGNAKGFLEVLAGFPQLKLWPDSVQSALQTDPESFPRLLPHYEKRAIGVREGFLAKSAPLSRVYLMVGGPEPAIENLRSRDALLGLLPHWYGARFGPDLLNHLGQAENLLQCGSIVNQVPVCLLRRPSSLNTLSDLVHLVEVQAEMDLEPLQTVI